MSELTPDDVRAVMPGIPLLDAGLQEIIDNEEAWLARRVGQLSGERTEAFRGVRPVQVIRLGRPAINDGWSLAVDDNGTDVTTDCFLLRNGWRVGRTTGSYWSQAYPTDLVSVTYSPADEADVQAGLLTLVRLAMATVGAVVEGVNQVTIGSFSYSIGTGAASPRNIRRAVVRSLQEPPEASTNRVRSSSIPEPLGRWPA